MKTATRYLEEHMVRDLAAVTDGRYRRVRVDDKTLDIEVHAPEKDDWVRVSSLSQGTVDLVYLVARLGLVRLVTGDRRPPLVFDDPFVTLDDARAARALELLKTIARTSRSSTSRRSPRYDEAADAVVVLDGPTQRRLRRATATAGAGLNEVGSAETLTVVLGLLSAIVWGSGDFGGGLLSRRTPVFGVVLVSQVVGMTIAAVIALAIGETGPLTADVVWSVLAAWPAGSGSPRCTTASPSGGWGSWHRSPGSWRRSSRSRRGSSSRASHRRIVLVGIALAVIAVVLVSRVPDDGTHDGPSAFASRSSAGSGSVPSAFSSRRSATVMPSGRWRSSGGSRA